MTRSDTSRGLGATRWLVLGSVVAVAAAVAVGVDKFREPTDDATVQIPSVAITPVVPEGPLEDEVAPVGMAEDVVSRVDASGVSGIPAAKGPLDTSHVGPRLDPDAYEPGEASPSHIGEYLDPDDEHRADDTGEASHIGDYLDPLADE